MFPSCGCCPVIPHPILCTCPCEGPVVQRGRVSFYPRSSSLRVGGRLFTSPVPIGGAHLVAGIVRAAQLNAFRLVCEEGLAWYDLDVHLAGRNGIRVHILFQFLPVTGRLLVIQRAVRRFLGARRARRARLLSVALAAHPRLGAQSPLALLPSDLLCGWFCGLGCST